MRLDVAGVPELEREFVIGLDLLGHRADVAELHAELVVGRAGLRVVRTPGVVAEGLELCEDFVDGHADDYTRNPKQGNLDRGTVVGQFELTHYPPETSAMKPATKRWISAGGRL